MRRMHVRTVVTALLLLTAVSWAGDKRGFSIEDYYKTAFVSWFDLSPDGKLLVYSVKHYDLAKHESWSEIWLEAADGSWVKQLTFAKKNDRHPIFSPDSRKILFVSDRDGSSQLYVMPVDGGEPKKVTDFPFSLSQPYWTPDGKGIVAQADVYPECGADAECNETISKKWEEGPLHAHMADDLLYRHWNFWVDGRHTHLILFDSSTGEPIRDLTPGDWDSPAFSLGGGYGYSVSPKGDYLCVASKRVPDPATSTDSDLFLVGLEEPAAVEKAVNLTGENDGWDGSPVFSPDGRSIAYLSQATPGYESDLFRLAVIDLESRKIRYLTGRSSFDDWVDNVQWGPEGRYLWFQAESKGNNPIYRIPTKGGSPEEVLRDCYIMHWELSPDGNKVYYSRRCVGDPPELFVYDVAKKSSVQLTHLNDDLEKEVDIRPAEQHWVNVGDYKVHLFIVKPHGFDPTQKYPLILNVHGGPQQQWTDAYRGDWQVYPGAGYVVAFANPTGSPGYGQDFVDAIRCDWGGRVFRDLMAVVDYLETLPYVDKDRIGAMGWSYGGYMIMWFEGHTDRFKALASMMGVYDLRSMYSATEELWFPEHDLCGTPWDNPESYKKWSPSSYVKNFSTPCLVITGEKDFRVPYTQSLQFFTDLRKMNVPARLVVFSEAGHWPSWYEMAFYYLVHLDWFHQWLGGGEAPWSPEEFLRNAVFSVGE